MAGEYSNKAGFAKSGFAPGALGWFCKPPWRNGRFAKPSHRNGSVTTAVQPWHHAFFQGQTVIAPAGSPDRRLIALAQSAKGAIELCDTASGTRRGVLPGHAGTATDLALSRDGPYLASASDVTTALVWEPHRPFHATTSAPAASAENWRILAAPDGAHADTAI